MSLLKDVLVLVRKELLAEWRTREILPSMGVFGILTLLVFNFAFPPGLRNMEVLTPGILWVAFIFAGILGLNRSMAQEKEEGCLNGLLLTPVDRGAIFLGKFLANFVFMSVLEAFILLVFAFFFNVELWAFLPALIPVIMLGTLGYIAVGTLFAAVAVQTRFQEVLLPILVIPLVAPVLIGAVKATGTLVTGGALEDVTFWLKFLFTFDGVFLVVCFLGFEYVVQE